MWYLLNAYWIPLLLAGLLGVIVGWISCNNEPNRGLSTSGWFNGWMPWAVAGAALAALAAMQTLLQGKQGLLLDTALMLFGAYMVGCCVGCMLKPKPAAHLAYSGATAKVGSGTSSKVATAAAAGTAASLAAAKSASAARPTSTTTTPASGKTEQTRTDNAKSGTVTNLTSSAASATGTDQSKLGTTTAAPANGTGKVATAVADATSGAATATVTAGKSVTATTAATSSLSSTPANSSGGGSSTAGASSGGSAKIVKVFSTAPKFGERPVLYSAPRDGQGDDLSLIWGVAEKLEDKMNAAGIWHFDQIANWSPANIDWFEHEFEGFKGRLDRDKWIDQCKKLAAGWRPEGHVGHRVKG